MWKVLLYDDAAVIMRKDFAVIGALFSHAVGSVLAHADSVSVPVGGECNIFTGCGRVKCGGGKPESFADLTAAVNGVSHSEFRDGSAFCA